MFIVAAKAGLGFAVVLAILGTVQTQSAFDPLLLFVTVGLVPGTNVEISPDVILLAAGAALMAITVWFFRRYNAYHAVLDAIMPEYVQSREDPDFTSLVPGLGKLLLGGKSALSAINDASIELYFWFRSFGRPAIAQAVIPRRGLSTGLVRFDRIITKSGLREDLEAVSARLQNWSREGARVVNTLADKAMAYFVRFLSS